MYRLLGVGTVVKAPPFRREQVWLLVITFLIGALCKKCIKVIVIRDCAREKKSRISFSVRAEIQPGPLFCVTPWAHRFAWSSKVLFKHLCFRHCSQSWRLIVIATGIHPSNSRKYKYHLSFFSSRFQHRTDDRCWGCPVQIRSLFKLLWGRLLLCVQVPFSRTSSVYHRPESAPILALIHRWIGIFRRECTC